MATPLARERRLTHVVAFDDAPFAHAHRGDVAIVGTVYAGLRLEGVLAGKVRRDGVNATRVIGDLVLRSRYYPQLHLVLLQGISFAGFNVIDLDRLHVLLDMPVLVVARRQPDLSAIRSALLKHVPGGARKWRLIEEAGGCEPVAGVFVQRAGLSVAEAKKVIEALAVHGRIPEPLRATHLIAGGIILGASTGRV